MQLPFDNAAGRADWDRAARPDRYFFALLPDPETARRIDARAHELRQRLKPPARLLNPRKYHLSLWSLHAPDGPESQEVALARRAAALIQQRPFSVGFDQVASFGSIEQPTLVLMSTEEMPAARRLHLAIGETLRRAGIKAGARPFAPHVSLLYDRRRLGPFSVPKFVWNVREFALVRSADREPYDVLGSWTLRG